MKYANEIYVDFFNAVQNETWKEEKKKKYYSEEEYKSLFLDFQKAIDFINKKNLAKELAEFIKKGDD